MDYCRKNNIKDIIYASSSSVYGLGKSPYTESTKNLEPNSFYGQTKLLNEKLSDLYAQAYGMSFVGLRFFTVYGAFGRPDMAYFAFANALVNKKPITLFNNGNNFRDMTHISDLSLIHI